MKDPSITDILIAGIVLAAIVMGSLWIIVSAWKAIF